MEAWKEGLFAVVVRAERMVDDDDVAEALVCDPFWDRVACTARYTTLSEMWTYSRVVMGKKKVVKVKVMSAVLLLFCRRAPKMMAGAGSAGVKLRGGMWVWVYVRRNGQGGRAREPQDWG